jgi:hypothetical protein
MRNLQFGIATLEAQGGKPAGSPWGEIRERTPEIFGPKAAMTAFSAGWIFSARPPNAEASLPDGGTERGGSDLCEHQAQNPESAG